MTNIRNRLAKLEAGRRPGSPQSMVGLAQRMRELYQRIDAGEDIPEPTGPFDPNSVAGRMRA